MNNNNIRETYLTENTAKLMLDQFHIQNKVNMENAQKESYAHHEAKVNEEKKKIEEDYKKQFMDYVKKIGMWILIINIFFMLIALFLAYRCNRFNIFHMLIACSCWVFYIPFRLFGECTKKKIIIL